jgi:hypothetical protein
MKMLACNRFYPDATESCITQKKKIVMKTPAVVQPMASSAGRRQFIWRRILGLSFAVVAALTLSGCVGLLVNTPEECPSETPYPGVHDLNLFKADGRNLPRPVAGVFNKLGMLLSVPNTATKAEFAKEWGEPDKIINRSATEETWIYEKHIWCGVCPVFLLPLPLVLPVCDGFDKVEFKDDVAMRLHTRRNTVGGFIIFFYPFAGAAGAPVKEEPCRNTGRSRFN